MVVFHGSRKNQLVALSFDDGPDWGELELVYTLNSAGMRATLFWIPEKFAMFRSRYPGRLAEIIQLIREGNHEVGIHGLTCARPNLLKRIFPENLKDIADAREKISLLVGSEPSLYRPHCVRIFLPPKGMRLIIGTHQLGLVIRPEEYFKIFEKAKLGDIICAHDSMNCNLNFGATIKIASIVPQITKILRDRGLGAVTVSEILS